MAKIRKDHRLEPELPRILVGGKQILLDGNIHAKVFIHRPVDGTHAALPKNFNDAVSFMK